MVQISRTEFKRRRARRGSARRDGSSVEGGTPRVVVPPGHDTPVDVPFDVTAKSAPTILGARTTVGAGLLASLRLADVPRSVLVALVALVALALALGLVLRAQACGGVVVTRGGADTGGETVAATPEAPAGEGATPGSAAGEPAVGEPSQAPALVEAGDASGPGAEAETEATSPQEGAGAPGSPLAPGGASTTGGAAASGAGTALVVHVTGAVSAPGVYRVGEGARIQDAVEAAGGAAPDADLEQINLAEPLVDGEKVRVPRIGEQAAETTTVPAGGATPSVGGAADAPGLVNINTAGLAELQTLPGVGPATAQAILDDRAAGGPFVSPEDLMRVSGIGEKKFAKLQGLICV